ncbi:winged helix-turn-helix transcriptional regulator [Mucilaginibacter mali]|uniref:Winged helix-turn-helix transcriptional regulator n=1 Tax=Mucilaginibacter mali TaxID=2740462 RepID=A0A7D4ULF9_9SPHI|nr:metalloregulator ArsR/SmtB family transcription factor [Mucilaginibacter mali]QKJ31802.1 winged helix-turn-helix transcriptional regulator [Mucilaginibacter mali]
MASNKKAEFTPNDQHISNMAKAMSHPGRIAIMRIVKQYPKITTGEIVEILPLAQATVSHHLKELQTAGLITMTADGKRSLFEINRKNWDSYTTSFNQLLEQINNLQ